MTDSELELVEEGAPDELSDDVVADAELELVVEGEPDEVSDVVVAEAASELVLVVESEFAAEDDKDSDDV